MSLEKLGKLIGDAKARYVSCKNKVRSVSCRSIDLTTRHSLLMHDERKTVVLLLLLVGKPESLTFKVKWFNKLFAKHFQIQNHEVFTWRFRHELGAYLSDDGSAGFDVLWRHRRRPEWKNRKKHFEDVEGRVVVSCIIEHDSTSFLLITFISIVVFSCARTSRREPACVCARARIEASRRTLELH